MKVLICDDEMFIRASLKSMLLELPFDLDIIGEAKNGLEALALIKEHTPDIVFIDIRMPTLNGLDTIREAKERFPPIYFIILSGFSEFEYAREGIQLGISDYLLKPVSPKELELVLGKILEDYRHKLSHVNQSFSRDFIASYYDSLPYKANPSILCNLNFLGLIYTVDISYTISNEKEELSALEEKIQAYLHTHHSLTVNSCILPLDACSYGIVLGFLNTSNILDTTSIVFEDFKTWLHTLCTKEYMITSIFSPLCKNLEGIKSFFETYFYLLPNRYFVGIGKCYAPSHFKPLEEEIHFINLGKYFKKLSIAYKNNDLLLLNKYLEVLTSEESLSFINQFPKLHPLLNESIFFILGCKLDYALDTWPKLLKNHIENQCGLMIKTNKYIEEIKNYVNTYYMEDIGVNAIASKLHVTPNYLSSMFHKTTGIKFSQFVKHIRIEKAKELLTTTSFSIKEIAVHVGYFSHRHFTKTFTEMAKMYPSEYRKKNI